MSYILDALKKADAQRERDPARGIHAQPAALPTLQAPGVGQRPWFWAAVAAGIAAGAAAVWMLTQDQSELQRPPVVTSEATVPRSAPVPAPAPAALGSAPTTPEPAAAVLPPPAPAAPPVAAAPGNGIVPPGQTAARAAPTARTPPEGAAASAQPAAPPVPATAPARPAAVPATAPAAAPTAPTAPSEPPIANGLPADAPKLAISGGVYSANRTQRMLIVNGQVVNEGADLGGGIMLEEIRPKAAVLRFRGGRYNVAF